MSKQRHGIGSPLSVSLCARKGTRQTRSPTGRGKLVFLQVRINIFIIVKVTLSRARKMALLLDDERMALPKKARASVSNLVV